MGVYKLESSVIDWIGNSLWWQYMFVSPEEFSKFSILDVLVSLYSETKFVKWKVPTQFFFF
jgi:hypothetical protein